MADYRIQGIFDCSKYRWFSGSAAVHEQKVSNS